MNPLKNFLTALILMVAQNLAFGQIFSIGPKVGFNYTTLPNSSSLITSQAGKAGIQIGAFARLGNKTYIQPEVLIGSNSSTFTYQSTGTGSTTINQDAKFTTLEIPVLLGHKLISLPLVNLRVMVGPDFMSFLKKPGLQVPNPGNYSYKDFSVGAVAGLGVDIANFTVDARYNFGINSINSGFSQRLNYFNLSIGLKFL